jgi:hypothetical protein
MQFETLNEVVGVLLRYAATSAGARGQLPVEEVVRAFRNDESCDAILTGGIANK